MANLKILIKEFLSNFYYKENNHIILNIFGLKFGIFRRIRNCKIKGKNNCFTIKYNGRYPIFNNFRKVKGLKIDIKGDNNVIILKSIRFKNCFIKIHSSNSTVEIGEKCYLNNLSVSTHCGNGQKLSIGEKVTCNQAIIFLHEENTYLSIGNDCMLSSNITIWPTDSHAIIDKITNKVLNKPSKVTIGDHSWIGCGVYICKNAKIPNNSVVGAGSVVTKGFDEENIIIAGNPAKIIKRNIKWDRATSTIKEKELNS